MTKLPKYYIIVYLLFLLSKARQAKTVHMEMKISQPIFGILVVLTKNELTKICNEPGISKYKNQDLWQKMYLILYSSFVNLTTHIAIPDSNGHSMLCKSDAKSIFMCRQFLPLCYFSPQQTKRWESYFESTHSYETTYLT